MADTQTAKSEAQTATPYLTADSLPTLLRVESGNGRDYPVDRNNSKDENRNTTIAVLHYAYGAISFPMNVYASFVAGRKAETLSIKFPPSVPKNVTISDAILERFLSAATEHAVAWIKANGESIAQSAKRSGQSLADILKTK